MLLNPLRFEAIEYDPLWTVINPAKLQCSSTCQLNSSRNSFVQGAKKEMLQTILLKPATKTVEKIDPNISFIFLLWLSLNI